MAASTKSTIGLIIDSTAYQQSVSEYLVTLHKTGQLDITQLLVISEQRGVPKRYFTKLGKLYPNTSIQRVATRTNISEFLKNLQADFIGYIPRGATPSLQLPDIASVRFNFLAPWLPDTDFPKETAKEVPVDAVAWIASRTMIQSVLPQLNELDNWTVLEVALALEKSSIPFQWRAMCGSESELPKQKSGAHVPLKANAKVLALVPHYHCEMWLHRCLCSLVTQTRPPEGIVVIDDGSGNPPVTIVEEFPSVTLLTAPSPYQAGPYRLIQQVIADTNYDAYLFQDADDWSTSDRLYKLLQAAEVSGAELVSTQELRVFEEESKLNPVCYPLDVNAALAEKPGHPLLHPSSLVARDLVQRLGGFATGLRFGGDTEFLLRAALVARIVNIPDYCYFRRKRAGSLTTAPDTGLDSAVRIELLKTLKNRALTNYTVCREGQQPCLEPLVKAEPIVLSHITGPQLSKKAPGQRAEGMHIDGSSFQY
ncbi:MAG: glycosyltransferase family 2 protein [Microcoleus sp. SIO2G3]|nr:glycosyltransferase family 2 protein [Microcoleus sp. SIO2G3]